ncbi:Dbl homology domain-containing protein, partial [Jimgerdemannia flammicorona]
MTTTLQMKRRTPSLGSLPNVAGMSIVEGPTPSNLNKPPTSASSLYHTCRSVLDRLACVPGFEYYLETEFQLQNSNSSESTSSTPSDPLTKLWQICRQGLSLCLLFNTLRPDKLIKLDDISGPNNGQSAKKAVYRFIVACKEELRTSDDELFTITELNQNDTNGFVKVVKTVSTILDRLEEKGIITVRSSNRNSDPNAPKNTRDKVVMELLETERKYVADMERLQVGMLGRWNGGREEGRRFLISVEANADAPSQEQRWGQLFQSQEEAFTVYEPFCANYNQAQDLAIQENLQLQKLASMIEPSYELPSLLIKPVQRICKYPLLLGELIKSTDKEWKYYDELVAGREAVQRVTMRVNEVQRKLENAQAVEELKRRVEDWKVGLIVDKFLMSSNDAERELHVFLFERILLICKEIKDANRNLQLKGKIFITSIIQVMNNGRNGKQAWTCFIYG